jgi:hypothetical protein
MDERQNHPSDEIQGLLSRKQVLESRLINGEEIIRREREHGSLKNAARWEQEWIGLLREYEQVCERLEELGE